MCVVDGLRMDGLVMVVGTCGYCGYSGKRFFLMAIFFSLRLFFYSERKNWSQPLCYLHAIFHVETRKNDLLKTHSAVVAFDYKPDQLVLLRTNTAVVAIVVVYSLRMKRISNLRFGA